MYCRDRSMRLWSVLRACMWCVILKGTIIDHSHTYHMTNFSRSTILSTAPVNHDCSHTETLEHFVVQPWPSGYSVPRWPGLGKQRVTLRRVEILNISHCCSVSPNHTPMTDTLTPGGTSSMGQFGLTRVMQPAHDLHVQDNCWSLQISSVTGAHIQQFPFIKGNGHKHSQFFHNNYPSKWWSTPI